MRDELTGNEEIQDQIEKKRRDEVSLQMLHEREARKVQGQELKEQMQVDQDIEEEIERLAGVSAFDPYQELVSKRAEMNQRINAAGTEDERNALMKELQDIDRNVKEQLATQARDQDKHLQDRLNARKKKRGVAAERDRALRQK